MLGNIYLNRWGVEKKLSKSQKNFLRAIELGNSRENYSLAKVYNLKLAKKYLNIALSNPSITPYCSNIDKNNLTIKGEKQ